MSGRPSHRRAAQRARRPACGRMRARRLRVSRAAGPRFGGSDAPLDTMGSRSYAKLSIISCEDVSILSNRSIWSPKSVAFKS